MIHAGENMLVLGLQIHYLRRGKCRPQSNPIQLFTHESDTRQGFLQHSTGLGLKFLFHVQTENCDVPNVEVSPSNMDSLLRSPGWSLRKERCWIISSRLMCPTYSFIIFSNGKIYSRLLKCRCKF